MTLDVSMQDYKNEDTSKIDMPFVVLLKTQFEHISAIKHLLYGTENSTWLDEAQDMLHTDMMSWKNKNKQ